MKRALSIRRLSSVARMSFILTGTRASESIEEEDSQSLGSKQAQSQSIQRDPLYYDAPLIILVSHIVIVLS